MKTIRFGILESGARCVRLLGMVLGIGSLVLLFSPGTQATGGAMVQAQRDDAAYEDEMVKGREFMRLRKYEDALKSFKRANEMRDKKSPECFFWLGEAYEGLGAHKNVMESCEKVIELAGSDANLRARAFNLKGVAIQSLAEGKDQRKLQEAEAAFRQGLALNEDLAMIHYNLGFTLMQQGRDPDGIAELKKYVELQPDGTNADQARKMIENPRRARENYAPEFSVTTSGGEYLALEELRGKVVLLDFWGTWCPPCVASVPSLRSLHKKFGKESSFVIIGISSDSEAEKWREFTAKNQMVWPQYLDRDRRVQRAFDVRAFPTYIVIDGEGIVRFRSIGMSSEKNLEDVIRKHMKVVAKASASA